MPPTATQRAASALPGADRPGGNTHDGNRTQAGPDAGPRRTSGAHLGANAIAGGRQAEAPTAAQRVFRHPRPPGAATRHGTAPAPCWHRRPAAVIDGGTTEPFFICFITFTLRFVQFKIVNRTQTNQTDFILVVNFPIHLVLVIPVRW